MNAIILRPCPFCGGAATVITIQDIGDRAPKFFGACTKCGVETPRTSRSRQEAADNWNRRPKPKGISAEQAPRTLYGYQMDQLLMVAELLQRHGVTPEDLHDLKNNFQRTFDILQEEQERRRREALAHMMRGFNEIHIPDPSDFNDAFSNIQLKKEAPKG